MRKQPTGADEQQKWHRLNSRSGDIAVVARRDQAKDQLQRCEVEQDRGDPLAARQPLGQHIGQGEEDRTARRRQNAGVEVADIGPRHDQDADEPHDGGQRPCRGQPFAQQED